MKLLYFFIANLLISQITFSQSLAPEVITSAGDFYSNGNVSLSWTLGEGVTETFSNGNNTLTQGFQQSNYNVVEIENPEENVIISLYPNPVTQFLNLEWDLIGNTLVRIEIFDINGKVIISKSFAENIAKKQIDLSVYPYAEYILRVSNGPDVFKTYKITKY